jgi:hypothetical protein
MNELPERWHIRVFAKNFLNATPKVVYDWRVKKYGSGWRCTGFGRNGLAASKVMLKFK